MTRWRYLAQRAIGGQWVHTDLPITVEALRWDLSGPGELRGKIAPQYGQMRATDGRPVLDEWGTLIYAEADRQIRWAGILQTSQFVGGEWSLTAAGFTSYPRGIQYEGPLYSRVGYDTATVFRTIWAHVQAQPDGNLGMVVDGTTTPARVGTKEQPYVLAWWENKDCGSELDSLASETPFDYAEEHTWAADRSAVTHRLRIGYPRLGRRRNDLSFVQGANVTSVVPVDRDGAEYANAVYGLGAGEGDKTIHQSAAVRDGRLRRPYVWTDKAVTTAARMRTIVRDQLNYRSQLNGTVRSISVADHPNAPIGSWQLGDDILVQASTPWLGRFSQWFRIISWSLDSESRATINLERADAFRYGGT